jgi:hypothetical protein
MNKFTVGYCPNISEKAEKIIIENITPSMTSLEGDSNQYNLDFIRTEIIDLFSEEDKKELSILHDEGIDYIEF